MPRGKITARSKRFRSKRRPRNTMNRKRFTNLALKPISLTSKLCYYLTDLRKKLSERDGIFYYTFKIEDLVRQFLIDKDAKLTTATSVFQEFRIDSVQITFHPDVNSSDQDSGRKATSTEAGVTGRRNFGNYATVVLDMDADVKIEKGPKSFKAIANIPGSVIRKMHQSTTTSWYPSEPSDRLYHPFVSTEVQTRIFTLLMVRDLNDTSSDWLAIDREMQGILILNIKLKARITSFNRAITQNCLMKLNSIANSEPKDEEFPSRDFVLVESKDTQLDIEDIQMTKLNI